MRSPASDELVVSHRVLDDVRRCAAGSAPACVAEIARRLDTALAAPPAQRDRGWARVVAAVNELLAGLRDRHDPPAARLRTFVRRHPHLVRPRDVAITDFRFTPSVERIVTDSRGRRYAVFAPIPRARPPAPALDEIVPGATRRFAEASVYALCGGAAAAALWLAFFAAA